MNWKSFFQNHYEKLILAVFLILFSVLLYLQLSVIKNARNKKVDKIVNAVEPPADFVNLDYENHPRFKMSTVFSNHKLQWLSAEQKDSASKVDLMTPVPMALCPHCQTPNLIDAALFPPKGSKDPGKCSICGKALKPRTSDLAVAEVEVVTVVDDADGNGLPDKWEKENDIAGLKPDVDSDKDGFNNLEEFRAKTNPKNAKSHPLYVTKLKLAEVPKKQSLESIFDEAVKKEFTGTVRLKSISASNSDKAKWEAEFTIKVGKKSTIMSTKLGEEILYRKKTSNDKVVPSIKFRLVDIIDAKSKKDKKAIIESTVGEGEKLRMECFIGKPIMTPYDLIVFENTADNTQIKTKTGAAIQLGTEATGIEKYTVVSVSGKDDAVVVTLEGADKTKWPVSLNQPEQNAAPEIAQPGPAADGKPAAKAEEKK